MRWRTLAALLASALLALLGAGLFVSHWPTGADLEPPATPKQVAAPSPPNRLTAPALADPSYATLAARLATVVRAHPVPGAVGVAVVDGAGRPVLLHHAEIPMIPASVQKLVTAAAALAALEPDFRYRTDVAATGAPSPDGTLAGDLVLVGSGDPALSTPLFSTRVASDRPRTPLEALADQVVVAGIRHVTGRLIGDPTVLADEPAAPGWLDRYLDRLDAGRVSGLTVDAGRQLFFKGQTLRARPSPDPAAEAAAALVALLAERGVTVAGGPASTRVPPATPVRVASVASPPLVDLLHYMVQRSDNHMADAVFRTLGRLDDGDGSWTASTLATRRSLEPLRLDWSRTVIADGSGLSRDNRLSAGFLAALDAAMRRSNAVATWDSLMAVAGESGTLRHRLSGTSAAHRLQGKTGSLEGVRSLVGSITGPAGARLHLAVIGNDLDGSGVQAVRALQDALAVAVAESLYRCPPAPAQCAA